MICFQSNFQAKRILIMLAMFCLLWCLNFGVRHLLRWLLTWEEFLKETEFNELGFYFCKPSSLNSFSILTNRVQ